jgi:magnesium-transporting ATPase (P-type)
VVGGVTFLSYQWMLDHGWSLARAQAGVLLLMVLFENVQVGNARSERCSALRLNPLRNPLLLFGTAAAQLVHIGAMYTPGLRDALGVQPVSLAEWATYLGLAVTVFVAIELHGLLRRWRRA